MATLHLNEGGDARQGLLDKDEVAPEEYRETKMIDIEPLNEKQVTALTADRVCGHACL